ncbi:hypothetical protein CRG98_005350 [Punica granatum]|uniref:DUF7745 domain-containing protein n=1 Tax=Punica granatum TaxID=22663 RepID=A0A2I0L0K4_PUNGR|nr:hypothetical protein CRG98_005350 [Punica granatum]
MSHSASFPRLDRVTPPFEQISHIWAALRLVDRDYIHNLKHVVFDIQGAELTPTIEEYWTLIGQTAVTHDIVEPNIYTTRPTLVSPLLGVQTFRLNAELAYSGSTEITIKKILIFIQSRVHKVQGDVFRKDLCHAFLLLIFGTLLFPHSQGLVDAALADVVLQVDGGREYEVAFVAKTIWSLDRVTRTCERRIRVSSILLQIWLQSLAKPFGLVRPVMGFKWRVAWISPRPMALKCPDFYGIPLMSHAGSTTYFPEGVMRQFGNLQTIPEDTARTRFQHTWREDQTFINCQTTMHVYAMGESCPPSRVDHSRSSPLHDQRTLILATHSARQASHANLRMQATCGLHPFSMARRAVDPGPTYLSRGTRTVPKTPYWFCRTCSTRLSSWDPAPRTLPRTATLAHLQPGKYAYAATSHGTRRLQAKSDARVHASSRTCLGPFPYILMRGVSDDEVPPTKPKTRKIEPISQHRCNRLPRTSSGFNNVCP